jgi:hypothetical protein
MRRLPRGRSDGPVWCATLWLLSVGRRSRGDYPTRRARAAYRGPRPRQNLPIVVDGPGAGLVCENSHFHPGLTQPRGTSLDVVTPGHPTAERRRVPSYHGQSACWDASPTVTTLPYIRLGAFSIPQSRLKPKCDGVTIPANNPVPPPPTEVAPWADPRQMESAGPGITVGATPRAAVGRTAAAM